jgi:hypothetical protein
LSQSLSYSIKTGAKITTKIAQSGKPDAGIGEFPQRKLKFDLQPRRIQASSNKIFRKIADQIDISSPTRLMPAVFDWTLPTLPLHGCRGGSAKKARKPGSENRWLCW